MTADIKNIYESIVTGLHAEPPLNTMKKKLIINVAPTGSFTSRQQNPLQPYTMEENVKAAIDGCKAGAAVWHVHAREPDGLPSKDPHVVKETIDRVLDKCPDVVTSVIPYADYTKQGVDQIKPTIEVLKRAGERYIETAVLLIMSVTINEKFTYVVSEKNFKETVGYLESHGVRPEYQGHAYSGMKDVMDWVLKTGIGKSPAIMNVMAGFHGFNHATPLSPDPWNYINIMSLYQVLPEDGVRGICAGGRNWLPFTVLGIMLGADIVRVGMEDSVFVHPHSDEKLKSSAQAVELVRTIAEAMGREIATPDEARQILGIKHAVNAGRFTAAAAPGR